MLPSAYQYKTLDDNFLIFKSLGCSHLPNAVTAFSTGLTYCWSECVATQTNTHTHTHRRACLHASLTLSEKKGSK